MHEMRITAIDNPSVCVSLSQGALTLQDWTLTDECVGS